MNELSTLIDEMAQLLLELLPAGKIDRPIEIIHKMRQQVAELSTGVVDL